MARHRKGQGFTLIELLIVVAVIGIIAALLIPNLIDALNKAKMKRTMVDVRSVGSAWMSWLADQVSSASAGAAKKYDASHLLAMDYVTVASHLRPTDTFFYMQEVPQHDGWGHELEFCKSSSLLGAKVMCICAACRDGVMEKCCEAVHETGPFLATDYSQDIVWCDGYFVRWPKGTRR